jgi:hypothetical protein
VWAKLGQVGLWIDTHDFSGFSEGDRDYIGRQLSAVLLSAAAAGIAIDRPSTDTSFDWNPPPTFWVGRDRWTCYWWYGRPYERS